MEIEAEVDGLYRLSLAEFTAARNALAGRLQKAAPGDAAARVKALAKPSAAAWAVNQVYWKARGAFDQLVDTTGRVREAVAAGVPAEEARRAMRTRSDALAAAAKEAESALVGAGHVVSPAVLRRVQANLEALAAGTSSAAPGRLAEDLDPPGLDALAGLAITEAPREAHSQEGAAGAADAAQSQAQAEADRAARRREAEAAAAAHADSVRRLEAARAECEEARHRVELAEARVREAEAAESSARAAVDATGRAVRY